MHQCRFICETINYYFSKLWNGIFAIDESINSEIIDLGENMSSERSIIDLGVPELNDVPELSDISDKISDEVKSCPIYPICPICIENIDNDLITTQCNHYFHSVCLDRWIHESNHSDCPSCRHDLSSHKTNQPIATYQIASDHDQVIIRTDRSTTQSTIQVLREYGHHMHPMNSQSFELSSINLQQDRGQYQMNPYGLQTSLDYAPF
jgi:hypothetical protein